MEISQEQTAPKPQVRIKGRAYHIGGFQPEQRATLIQCRQVIKTAAHAKHVTVGRHMAVKTGKTGRVVEMKIPGQSLIDLRDYPLETSTGDPYIQYIGDSHDDVLRISAAIPGR